MLISVSQTGGARCWRRLHKQLMKEAWCVTVALMLIIILGPKNFGPIHYRILWHDNGYLWLE